MKKTHKYVLASITGIACFVALFFMLSTLKKIDQLSSDTTTRTVDVEELRELKKSIRDIALRVVDLTSEYDLWRIEPFLRLRGRCDLVEEVVEILGDEHICDLDKRIAVLAMQASDLESYMFLCRGILSLFRENRLERIVADTALFPCAEWTTVIQRNYRLADVKYVLEEYARLSPDSRESVERVLSGDCWKQTRMMAIDGMLELDRYADLLTSCRR